MKYTTVIVESPFRAATPEQELAHGAYLRAAMLDCLRRGEAPFASHALYTQMLDDGVPEERAIGIEAGLAVGDRLEKTVVYQDYGISEGMKLGIERAKAAGRPVEYRTLGS